MKSGKCPKCDSSKIYSGAEVPWKKGASSQYALKVSAASSTALDRYVCVDCGYVESYVGDRHALEAIAGKWPRVAPPRAD